MSPPTRPALSAGESGGHTSRTATPPSASSNSLMPKYDRGGLETIRAGGATFLRKAVRTPPTTKSSAMPIRIHVIPPTRRLRLVTMGGPVLDGVGAEDELF